MIEILPQSTGNVVAVRVNGKLVHEDYQQFIPQLEQVLAQYGSLRCYCEMTNFEGVTWQAMLDEMKFDVQHCNQIERCAIVTDASWSQWVTKFSQLVFHNAQIETFPLNETEEAWNWVTQNAEYCGTTAGTGQSTTGNTAGTGNQYGNTGTGTTGTGQNQNTRGYTGGTPDTSTGTTSGQTN